jgi:hypothetical protein
MAWSPQINRTLAEALIPERIPYARQPLKLPVVLSADEVVQFLEAVSSLKSRAVLTTAYWVVRTEPYLIL